MYIFFEKVTRGGIPYISNRLEELTKNIYFDPKESKHIIYLDINNVYGYAVSTFLSTT